MGEMAEYYDERMDDVLLREEDDYQEWLLSRDELDMMRLHHEANAQKPKGSLILCSACGKRTLKRHPAKATCSRRCLDYYHNAQNPRGRQAHLRETNHD